MHRTENFYRIKGGKVDSLAGLPNRGIIAPHPGAFLGLFSLHLRALDNLPQRLSPDQMEVCKTGDLQIAYRVKGQGEDVLLLHGFPDSSTLWDRQVILIAYRLFL